MGASTLELYHPQRQQPPHWTGSQRLCSFRKFGQFALRSSLGMASSSLLEAFSELEDRVRGNETLASDKRQRRRGAGLLAKLLERQLYFPVRLATKIRPVGAYPCYIL